jgi:cytochrome c biogenesis protein CcmG, thiol:disulfide interchange protein DsbE
MAPFGRLLAGGAREHPLYANVMNMRRLFIHAFCALSMLAAAAPRAAGVGDVAPAFALADAQAKTVSLASLKGHVVYVDFWASWCGPCRRSFPWMNAMQAKYAPQGFTVVAVNVDKRRGDAERFLADVPAQFTIVFDPAGATPTAYDVKAMPSSVLVGADGKVALVEEGFHDARRDALEAKIRALLAH